MTGSNDGDLASALHAHCLFCGTANPRSWSLKFHEDVNYTYAEFEPQRHLNGYEGILHGGVVAALLDETMVQCLLRQGIAAVTVDLQVRYEQPTPVERPLRVQARLLGKRHALHDMEAQLLDGNKVCAWAKARFFKEKIDAKKV